MAVKKGNGRLYQRVAEELVVAIRGGEFALGSRLPAERKLAERFEVSRPTIRESIIALEIAGYVEVKGGSGVYVTSSSESASTAVEMDLGPFEILEARVLCEGEAAALAARFISDDELVELEQALEDMREENERGVCTEEADEKFHLIIARATQNGAMTSVCEHLWWLRNNSILSAHTLAKVRNSGSLPRIEEHQAIYDALSQRDADAARQAMREHLNRVIVQLLDATETEAVEAARRQVENERARFSGS